VRLALARCFVNLCESCEFMCCEVVVPTWIFFSLWFVLFNFEILFIIIILFLVFVFCVVGGGVFYDLFGSFCVMFFCCLQKCTLLGFLLDFVSNLLLLWLFCGYFIIFVF